MFAVEGWLRGELLERRLGGMRRWDSGEFLGEVWRDSVDGRGGNSEKIECWVLLKKWVSWEVDSEWFELLNGGL